MTSAPVRGDSPGWQLPVVPESAHADPQFLMFLWFHHLPKAEQQRILKEQEARRE